VLRGAVALWVLFFAVGACAQVSGSLTLVSDYRYRGISLSDEQPAAQVSIAYDHSSGWYAGAFASTVDLANQSRRDLQLLSYVGYARRARPGLSWEVGAGYSAFTGARGYDYPEVFWGVTSDRVSARIYYAPDYFGQGPAALYVELNGTRPLTDRLHLLGHIGVLRLGSRSAATYGSGRYRFDGQAGIGIDLDGVSIQLAWVATATANAAYPASESRTRNALVVSVSRMF
jgi:uncharacterized protein (TIGR02001 family)